MNLGINLYKVFNVNLGCMAAGTPPIDYSGEWNGNGITLKEQDDSLDSNTYDLKTKNGAPTITECRDYERYCKSIGVDPESLD